MHFVSPSRQDITEEIITYYYFLRCLNKKLSGPMEQIFLGVARTKDRYFRNTSQLRKSFTIPRCHVIPSNLKQNW